MLFAHFLSILDSVHMAMIYQRVDVVLKIKKKVMAVMFISHHLTNYWLGPIYSCYSILDLQNHSRDTKILLET
jgi:hypothetical protein